MYEETIFKERKLLKTTFQFDNLQKYVNEKIVLFIDLICFEI